MIRNINFLEYVHRNLLRLKFIFSCRYHIHSEFLLFCLLFFLLSNDNFVETVILIFFRSTLHLLTHLIKALCNSTGFQAVRRGHAHVGIFIIHTCLIHLLACTSFFLNTWSDMLFTVNNTLDQFTSVGKLLNTL